MRRGRAHPRRRWSDAVMASAVGLSLLLTAPVRVEARATVALSSASEPSGEESARERAQQLYVEGSALYSASDYTGAIEKFTEALKTVTLATDLDPQVRGALIYNLGKSHLKAYAIDQDASHLRTARDLFERHINEARQFDYADQEIARSEEELANAENLLAELEAKSGAAAAEPEPTSQGGPPPEDREPGRRRGLAIGLLVAGSVLVAGGIGMLAFGSGFKRAAEDEIEDPDNPTSDEKDFLNQETRKGRIWMGAGGGLMAVGAAGVVVGAVILAKAKKDRKAKLGVAPVLDRDWAGVALSGRF